MLGDSHVAQWFPALERIAARNGFALFPMTKSSCPAPDVTVLRMDGSSYPECDEFREAAFVRIRELEPAVVVLSSSFAYSVAPSRWQAGYERTVRALDDAVGRVIVLGDTPYPGPADVPTCISENLTDARVCTKARDDAVNDGTATAERRAARRTGAQFVDPSEWICTPRRCPVIVGRTLLWRDNNHLTPAYVRSLSAVLASALGLNPREGTSPG
jgi:hypothetical protein